MNHLSQSSDFAKITHSPTNMPMASSYMLNLQTKTSQKLSSESTELHGGKVHPYVQVTVKPSKTSGHVSISSNPGHERSWNSY